MGERNFPSRYKDARTHADEQARALAQGVDIRGWHYEPAWMPGQPEPPKVHLEGAAWVAWMYQIAAENATTCVQVHGKHWQAAVDECERLAQEYRQKVGTVMEQYSVDVSTKDELKA